MAVLAFRASRASGPTWRWFATRESCSFGSTAGWPAKFGEYACRISPAANSRLAVHRKSVRRYREFLRRPDRRGPALGVSWAVRSPNALVAGIAGKEAEITVNAAWAAGRTRTPNRPTASMARRPNESCGANYGQLVARQQRSRLTSVFLSVCLPFFSQEIGNESVFWNERIYVWSLDRGCFVRPDVGFRLRFYRRHGRKHRDGFSRGRPSPSTRRPTRPTGTECKQAVQQPRHPLVDNNTGYMWTTGESRWKRR